MTLKEIQSLNIFSEKIISKKVTTFATSESEIFDKIIRKIVAANETDTFNVFEEKLDNDEKIDIYLFWKNMLIGIIETKIQTENYSYYHYCCCFVDEDASSINLNYVMYNNNLIDVSIAKDFDYNTKIEIEKSY